MGEVEQTHVVSRRASASSTRLALALGGGAARGLSHIGVLDVLEREGIRPDCIAGSSMGGLIGALSATGLRAREIIEVARSFHFPRWFLPGGVLQWDSLFGSAVPILSCNFEQLATSLVVAAVDLEAGSQVVLHTGSVLPAVRATCAVPGVLPAVRLGGRWLVDGGLVNTLPVDVAWMADPDIVVAVKVGAPRARRVPQLSWRLTSVLSRLGGVIPNPATAKVSFEVLVRAAEIVLDRQTALAAAMTGPEVLIEPELGDITLRDFHRLDEAVAAGRRAAETALPGLLRLLESPPHVQAARERVVQLRFDPVCAMVISPARARATVLRGETTYYFCSPNCRDCFERDPDRYLTKCAFRSS
jgi:NTE family protein